MCPADGREVILARRLGFAASFRTSLWDVDRFFAINPAMNCRATIGRPSGTGTVGEKMRFIPPFLEKPSEKSYTSYPSHRFP
jgi:hypothetical protein